MKFNNFLTKNPYLILFVCALMVVFSVTYFTLAQGTVTTIGEYIEIKEPTADNHAATKAYVDASIPPGSLDWSQAYAVVETRDGSDGVELLILECGPQEVLRDHNIFWNPSGVHSSTHSTSIYAETHVLTSSSFRLQFRGYGTWPGSFGISGLCVPYTN